MPWLAIFTLAAGSMSNAELVISAAGLLATAGGAVAVQLWRLADRLARLEERVGCCERLARDLGELEKKHSDHQTALARGGLL